MKTSPLFHNSALRQLTAAAIASASLMLGSLNASAGEVVAGFEGGNTTSVVDAWRGKAGDGWATAWSTAANGDFSSTVTTATNNPLTADGGRRLSVSGSNGVADSKGVWVARQYSSDVIDYSQHHTISFEFRLDTSFTEINRIHFAGTKGGYLAPSDGTPSWWIRIDGDGKGGGSLKAYSGNAQGSSLATLASDTVYRFTIDIYPMANPNESYYVLTVENISGATPVTVVTSATRNFHTPASEVAGYMEFVASSIGYGQLAMSLDNIRVFSSIPEPSTAVILFGGTVLLMARKPFSSRRLKP